MSDRFENIWAAITGLLCVLVMLGLAFTGPVALAGGLIVLALSFGLRWLVRLIARHRQTWR
jgi:hypothetical protein